MLTVQIVNVTGLLDNRPCNYEVDVQVNGLTIWAGLVVGHIRKDGWPDLLRRIADAGDTKRCPHCGAILLGSDRHWAGSWYCRKCARWTWPR
jgi:hypothetical protein